MASVGEKFDAAVTVIKKLPKNGPFQPSYELMKRFYGLYKQATEGPCHETKPAFWNVVQTQKWQAWSVLGDMGSDEAKRLYVEELLQIIETMPQTDEVVIFLKVMGPFFELVHEGEPEHVPASSPQVTKVNGHVNGGVKMKETKVDERGDQAKTVQNGDQSDVSDYTNGYLEDDLDLMGRSKGKTEQLESSSTDVEVNGHSEEGEVTEEETTESRYVRVVSSHQGENSAELSHPILISKSQLEAAEEHLPSTSESDSDGDEFCDSVDEPLISRISVAHISKTDSLPSVMEEEEAEEERRKHLTSTPFNGDHAVVTRADVHNNVDAVILPQYTSSSSSAPTISTPSMRGGGEVTEGSKGHEGQDSARNQSGQGHSSGYRSSDSFQNLPSSGSQDSSDGGSRRREGGGAGRGIPGGDGSPLRSPLPDGMVEQITISLERLQRDMNSVLVRLNTLETIAISRHQLETQQAYMREGIPLPQGSAPIRTPPQPATSSWWPFPTLPTRTVFLLLVWPFIVQWILRFLARHRRARPPPR